MLKPHISKLLIVVLYKTDISSASSLQAIKFALSATSADKIFIWDNSTRPQTDAEIEEYASQLSAAVEYRHTPDNISLARIYNTIISENRGLELVFIFDQDSSFDATYFEEIEEAASANKHINLFLPLITVGDKYVSPGHFQYFKGKYWVEPHYGMISAKNTVAVMSGMCIRMVYLKTFGGFNEALKLYGIDTNFMIRYGRDNQYLYVIHATFKHHLSDFTAEPHEVKRRRFADFKKSSQINATLFPWPIRVMTHAFLFYRTLKNLMSR